MKYILLGGKYKKVVKVDESDFAMLSRFKWMSAMMNGGRIYAYRYTRVDRKPKLIFMHRELMFPIPAKLVVDHKDGDTLNNTRGNLRLATSSQNSANRKASGASKFLGVGVGYTVNTRKSGEVKRSLRWQAIIYKDHKRKYLGCFPFTPEGEIEAARAYDLAATEIHGEFANLNFKKSA